MRDGDLIVLGQADARRIPLADESVQCVITSPSYWGLRDYQVAGQIGLEASPDEYVAQMVAVFREVWRVLRKDGTAWIVLGDSFSSGMGNTKSGMAAAANRLDGGNRRADVPSKTETVISRKGKVTGLAPKNLCMIPARVALALQADGWWLRSDIIWAKGVSFCPTYSGSVMPESVRDRPTQSYEHVFLLAKSKRYFYDATAVREEARYDGDCRHERTDRYKEPGAPREDGGSRARTGTPTAGRNLRSVWTINPKPSRLKHYAAFPPALVEPMVLAGTSQRGCCPECGRPWERVVEKGEFKTLRGGDPFCPEYGQKMHGMDDLSGAGMTGADGFGSYERTTTGWRPGCDHYPVTDAWVEYSRQQGHETDDHYQARIEPVRLLRAELLALWEPCEAIPCTVLDPFGGTMTVGQVCAKHGRHFVGLDLKREYVEMGRERCADTQMAMAL